MWSLLFEWVWVELRAGEMEQAISCMCVEGRCQVISPGKSRVRSYFGSWPAHSNSRQTISTPASSILTSSKGVLITGSHPWVAHTFHHIFLLSNHRNHKPRRKAPARWHLNRLIIQDKASEDCILCNFDENRDPMVFILAPLSHPVQGSSIAQPGMLISQEGLTACLWTFIVAGFHGALLGVGDTWINSMWSLRKKNTHIKAMWSFVF